MTKRRAAPPLTCDGASAVPDRREGSGCPAAGGQPRFRDPDPDFDDERLRAPLEPVLPVEPAPRPALRLELLPALRPELPPRGRSDASLTAARVARAALADTLRREPSAFSVREAAFPFVLLLFTVTPFDDQRSPSA